MASLTLSSSSARARFGFLLTPKALFGLTVLSALVICGLFAPLLAPFDPAKQDLMRAMIAPQPGGPHVLGTDHVGRDLLSRLIYGARVSLLIAAAVVLFSGAFGVALGVVSGYFGGRTDSVIQKFLEVFWAFPPLLLAIAIVAFLGQGLGIVILALASQRWIPYCRMSRAEAMALRDREFVVAARSLGAGHLRVLWHHILPNILPSTLVVGTFAMATAIISEAALSFLGLGVPPTIPTWGGMLADARSYISTSWWMALFPGLCIFVTLLGINLLGDVLRARLDPKIRNL
ncbi:ABC transporter permease [Pseudotabrizicola alkalilacus]|uniref:ABC transporter permease n=1 Tax=Pseudotabrizicola alkalilacus TaxID=2305252 RepID=A0A411YXN3_9RHOB|nr:ABC transporter permease [Pseudotabrizicola alkalilacus]RGP35572.1 ABC transporter permease [Pseudotabrizicola alkalilacus]